MPVAFQTAVSTIVGYHIKLVITPGNNNKRTLIYIIIIEFDQNVK